MKTCSGHMMLRERRSQLLHERPVLRVRFMATVHGFALRQLQVDRLVGRSIKPLDLSLLTGSIRRVLAVSR